MPIRVVSFDFDGCLFNSHYIRSVSKNIIKFNTPFLESLKANNNKYTQSIAMIGSNRQSFFLDFINSQINKTKSCFEEIQTVANFLEFTLDKTLMADIYGDLTFGTSYQSAVFPSGDESNHAGGYFDSTKSTLLYAQMHKIANEHPDEEIHFDFYDDTFYILSKLKQFYKDYPDLIPNNVHLNVYQYDGPKSISETKSSAIPIVHIKGEGCIDTNFRNTVLEMAEITIKEHFEIVDNLTVISPADHLDPDLLTKRVPFVAPVAAPLSYSLFHQPMSTQSSAEKNNHCVSDDEETKVPSIS